MTCSLERHDYYVMYHVAFVFLCNIVVLLFWVYNCIEAAYVWQYGN